MLTIDDCRWVAVVPWHNEQVLSAFKEAWGDCQHVLFQRDTDRQGGAITKNAGISAAIRHGATHIAVLDSDCFPSDDCPSIEVFLEMHRDALQPVHVTRYHTLTAPVSRGTPYFSKSLRMPVAASLGFWKANPDYDAAHTLVLGAHTPCSFNHSPVYAKYFPFCGMNYAFSAVEYPRCCMIPEAGRFDDIFAGYIWQKLAYAEGKCFNLHGPIVTHSRQSDVFANNLSESRCLKLNETIWQSIEEFPDCDYHTLLELVHLKVK